MEGKLYICTTPIGNLGDITIRALETLKEVDFIAAEDTRHTIKLLNHFDIKKRMVSCHEHNEMSRSTEIINRVLAGESCALVSDAGMPGISDPGEILIKEAIKRNVEVVILPGATAFASALVISGLDTHKFVFEGFLAHKKSERTRELENLRNERRTMIFYESPHRLKETLKIMMKTLGDRNMSISREITKKFEETVRGNISFCLDHFESKDVKGEFVIVVEGSSEEEMEEEVDVRKKLIELLDEGYTKKDAVKKVSKDYNLHKNEVYQISLEI
ncbi:16S rRNA (cytidine1402-2'-O)-methyltransferase [Dethiosulfatibacter aminovorans DSM 17477]|uniref:Ribosomal RNA small subunit methyltransferase I n=1 Tax=Dethiosulfatibacter aminovorans DSM 17477 TaxID=1121476 RepID=A0A1M6GTF3_9FIRM|nr:16S rRNA (cytidine(1402)-2'-O)-methyltransferase [Dethiosulfatibacter aminovorans]SHJ13234.1 16S rRNA (cytidine1402-2'-O)-methyltransferase [Dethiosulfatibacter aminovorans DSM 17477]